AGRRARGGPAGGGRGGGACRSPRGRYGGGDRSFARRRSGPGICRRGEHRRAPAWGAVSEPRVLREHRTAALPLLPAARGGDLGRGGGLLLDQSRRLGGGHARGAEQRQLLLPDRGAGSGGAGGTEQGVRSAAELVPARPTPGFVLFPPRALAASGARG